jgi:gluconolactonase
VPGARLLTLGVTLACFGAGAARAQTTGDVPAGRPAAVVDLATDAGARLVEATWRYHDARIVEVDHRLPGPDLRPSGAPTRTHDIAPQAGGADFDDSAWETIAPESLDGRRSAGRLAFNWYRINVKIPPRVGAFDPTGSAVVFQVVVDDYAEVWVDGRLPLALGQTGGPAVKGFNAPNRVVIARDSRPGQRIQLAVFGINGPLSSPPANFIWIRSATLEFHPPGVVGGGRPGPTEVRRLDPRLDAVVPRAARIERLAGGFEFVEGPVWVPDGYLLFSDPNANAIYRWTPDGEVSVFRTRSGYTGVDIGAYGQPGSNGLALDAEGRLAIAEHGNRRVTRLERNGQITVLADRYDGKRLNSPNDLVYRSDGTLYFTDPPFGLPRMHADPGRELAFSGVFRLRDGELALVSRDLEGPNGLAFAPDERHLYIANWDLERKIVMRYAVASDGALADGVVFFDATGAPGEGALDGLKVDETGNVYVSGPGGIFVVAPDGVHLGTIVAPERPANFVWGDADGRTLYLTARTSLYRIRLGVAGAGRRRTG